jgi:hypothetical protein
MTVPRGLRRWCKRLGPPAGPRPLFSHRDRDRDSPQRKKKSALSQNFAKNEAATIIPPRDRSDEERVNLLGPRQGRPKRRQSSWERQSLGSCFLERRRRRLPRPWHDCARVNNGNSNSEGEDPPHRQKQHRCRRRRGRRGRRDRVPHGSGLGRIASAPLLVPARERCEPREHQQREQQRRRRDGAVPFREQRRDGAAAGAPVAAAASRAGIHPVARGCTRRRRAASRRRSRKGRRPPPQPPVP